MKALPLAAVALLAFTSCVRLDTFVWEAVSVSDDRVDLMAASVVPAQFRQEIFDPSYGIVSPDGTVVDGYLLTHLATDGTPVNHHGTGLLYCHGQANDVATSVPRTDALWSAGYTVLAIDYRGFGKTKGKPTDPGIYEDTLASLKWLGTQPGLRVGVYGRSLGTAVCLKAAVEGSATALVLESPISSIQQIIDDSMTVSLPSDYFVDSDLNNDTTIPGFTGYLLIMHGSDDTYVPPKYGEQLQALAQGHAKIDTFWLVPGANHDTVPCTQKAPASVENSCVGGQAGFSSEYFANVNQLYETAFGN